MAEPVFYFEGSTPSGGEGEHILNQKILGAARSRQGGSGVSDDDLISLTALGTTGLLVRRGEGDWVTRGLTRPSIGGIEINFSNGVNGNPTFGLQGDLNGLEGLAGTGFAARTVADPEAWTNRTLIGSNGIGLTNGNGVAGNPSVALDINGMTEETTADEADLVAVHNATVGQHFKSRLTLAGGVHGSVTNKRVGLSRSSNLFCGHDLVIAVPWQVEEFDNDTMWGAGLPEDVVFTTAGAYHISAYIQWTGTNFEWQAWLVHMDGSYAIKNNLDTFNSNQSEFADSINRCCLRSSINAAAGDRLWLLVWAKTSGTLVGSGGTGLTTRIAAIGVA